MSTLPTISRSSSSPAFRIGQIVTVNGAPHIVVSAWRGSPDVDEDFDGRGKRYASVRPATADEVSAAARATPVPAPVAPNMYNLVDRAHYSHTEYRSASAVPAGPEIMWQGYPYRLADGYVWAMTPDKAGEVVGSNSAEALAGFAVLAG